jgi:pyrroline-5-carboxylate reductase
MWKIASWLITVICDSSIKYSKIFISERNRKISKELKKEYKNIFIKKNNHKIVDNSNWVFLDYLL